MIVRKIGMNGSLVVLSRRNLITLLSKLDQTPKGSACMIVGSGQARGFAVVAQEDEVHYQAEISGRMHPAAERAIVVGRTKEEMRGEKKKED